MVIGVSYHAAPVEVRERFWMSESGRRDALVRLSRSEGIEEIVVLATCERTEFLLWTHDVSTAAGSVLNFLTREYGLRLCEWKHFHRLLDEAAIKHIFRVVCSLDSMVMGDSDIAAQVNEAWALAQEAGTAGQSLDRVIQKALSVSTRVYNETAIRGRTVSVPRAAVELAWQIFGTLQERVVVLFGTGKMGEGAARCLVEYGVSDLRVIDRTLHRAEQIAGELGGVAVGMEERWQHLAEADIVISSSSCALLVFTREEAELLRKERGGRPLLLIDIAVPREVERTVRDVHGMFLYDIDDVKRLLLRNSSQPIEAIKEAEEIVAQEAKFFRHKLLAEAVVLTTAALRSRLDEICRQELGLLCRDAGALAPEQQRALTDLADRISQRIAEWLERNAREHPQADQERLTAAVERLSQLAAGESSAAGAN